MLALRTAVVDKPAGEFWGGLAAMLVALPSAIAFGVTIFSPLGESYAAQGALAGILGAAALGVIAPIFGGANRLVTAPCAPAAAVLAAAAIELTARHVAPQSALVMLALIGFSAGLLQLVFGAVGLGRLIKYMPYPVVSGYLSGVGLIIIVSQVPRYLGAPKDATFWQAVSAPQLWTWQGIVVGTTTLVVMLLAPRITKLLPAAILGLAAGLLSYMILGLADARLFALAGNALVIGPVHTSGGNLLEAIAGRWQSAAAIGGEDLRNVMVPAATLAVLLSIDTLKTCVVLDALTRSRHDSNQELIGQGLANVGSAVIGGVPGAGTMGATLVNITSGGKTSWSALAEGALVIVAFLLLAPLIAWVPIAALAGILIVIGVRMFDRHSLQLLKSRSTILDFVVIVVVVIVAETVSLIAASGVGIALAILLFIREQVGGSVVRRKSRGGHMFSKQVRLKEEMAILERRGERTTIVELQGSLFFGTTEQLYAALEPDLKTQHYLILDMRRVQSIDVTAAHVLEQVESILAERNALLIFSQLPRNLPSGQDMREYFDQVGLVKSESHTRAFGELDEALEWVENRLLAEEQLERTLEKPLELHEMALFNGRKPETLAALAAAMESRSYRAGEKICATGDTGTELFLIRRGAVRIMLPLNSGKQSHHLATFSRGNFFGEVSFFDAEPRSADAIALTDTDLYALSRE
ncbi:MAG TPA: SulP family inorganic anion transporter, partial [Burkholderiales bacterium]|nr:SulP family inorganic anion transporter [Burkholderiales bacterium]